MFIRVAIVVISLVIVVVIAGGLLAGPQLLQGSSMFSAEQRRMEVRAERAAIASLTEVVKAPGAIEPKKLVNISAEVSAKIERLPFEEGDTVRMGDVVVKLDDRDLKAALEATRARHDSEKFRQQSEQARLEGSLSSKKFAERHLERQQSLYETGDISKRELDDAMERVEDLDAVIEAAKFNISVIESNLVSLNAEIDRATEALSKTVITSPMDGIITALNTEEGEVAMVGTMNNPGTVIMTIADLDRMLLKAEVSENDVAKVQIGQEARVFVTAYQDEVFSGNVTHIALTRSVSGDGSGYFEAEIELDLQGRQLRSGLTANVDIEVNDHEGVVVPSQCIIDMAIESLPEDVRDHPLVDRRKTVTFVVYRIVDGNVTITPVLPGPSDLTHQLVLRGLEADDWVVTGPYKILAEGLKEATAVTGEWDASRSAGQAGADDPAADSTDATGDSQDAEAADS